MYYEINVALNGRHFFATAERSIPNALQLADVLPAIIAAFPEAGGFKVTVVKYETIGKHLRIADCLRKQVKQPGGIELAYPEMMRRIEAGREFPDASAGVAIEYGVSVDELKAMYDEEKP